MAESRSVKLTYDDFLHFPDDGKRHEIIDGEHYVTPSPNTRHQIASVNLTRILSTHVRSHGLGRVFSAPFDVVFSHLDVVEPDLLFISAKRLDILTDKHVRGAPDLVVEILSDSTRKVDENVKRALYERCGVQEYWVVDAAPETIKIRRRENDRFGSPAELSAGAGHTLTSPLLPGLSLRVSEIFE